MKNRYLFLVLSLTLGIIESGAQVWQNIDYNTYINEVQNKNIAYAAEKLNIPISDAEIQASKVFNDPSISFEYGNNQNWNKSMGQTYSVGLSQTISIGKRDARVKLAESGKLLNEAVLSNFFNDLRANATGAYLSAIRQKELYKVKLNSYESIRDLSAADSLRYLHGTITEVDAMQSQLELKVAYNELMQAKTDLQNSFITLGSSLGAYSNDTILEPKESLLMKPMNYSLADLQAMAVENRTELKVAMRNTEFANKSLDLIKRERWIDFDLSLGYNYNTEVRNELAPAPSFNGVSVGVSIPLKFSNANKGSITSGRLKAMQAANYYSQAVLDTQVEVATLYNNYSSLCDQLKKFDNGILDRAAAVLKGKIYSYNRGETSLLEVLNAQRTYNDVRALYIETLYNKSIALVSLEKSVGIWNISID